MKLKPGHVAEYRARHDAIWPKLVDLLRVSGVRDYSIYIDEETLTLFGVLWRTAGPPHGRTPANRRDAGMVGLHGRPDGNAAGRQRAGGDPVAAHVPYGVAMELLASLGTKPDAAPFGRRQ